MTSKLLGLAFIICLVSTYDLSMFYCGFSSEFCGQSKFDDVNPKSDYIMLAFANIRADGNVVVDNDNFPSTRVARWQRYGKKVFLSVGGQSGKWAFALATSQSRNNFANSVAAAVRQYNLDGADLDLEYYAATPKTVANTIILLKRALGYKLLMVTPECVTVYQGTPVPSENIANVYWNYFVPIIRLADDYIDIYQIQAYNNWYNGWPGSSIEYLKDVYLNWRNLQGLFDAYKPIEDFSGINPNKMFMGLLASSSAGVAGFYREPSTIREFKNWLKANYLPLKGFMIWDSYWDYGNNFIISNVVKQ